MGCLFAFSFLSGSLNNFNCYNNLLNEAGAAWLQGDVNIGHSCLLILIFPLMDVPPRCY